MSDANHTAGERARARSGALWLVATLAGYAAVLALMIPHTRYRVNPDGIAYLNIAGQYARGEWTTAVNAYWGPLLSWLLVPLARMRVDLLVGYRVLAVLLGGLLIAGVRLLAGRFGMRPWIRALVTATVAGLAVWFASAAITPDLLLTAILVVYLAVLFDPAYARRRYSGWVCGVLGGLAFLSKQYALPFFLVHFPLFSLLHLWRADAAGRGRIVRHAAAGLLVFAVVCVLWGTALGAKYGRFTLGSTGRYNALIIGPARETAHPMFDAGFLPPPHPGATAAWEDPTYTADAHLQGWNPVESGEHRRHAARRLGEGVLTVLGCLHGFSRLSIAIGLAALGLGIVFRLRGAAEPVPLLYAVATAALFAAGYVPFIIRSRYFWFSVVLLVLMAGVLLERWAARTPRRLAWFVAATGILVCATFLRLPVKTIRRGSGNERRICRAAHEIRERWGLEGSMASRDEWLLSLYLAYHMGMQYYGQALPGAGADELAAELRRHGIDYYVVTNPRRKGVTAPRGLPEITGGAIPWLRIWDCRPQ